MSISKSFNRLNITNKQGFTLIWNFFNKDWYNLVLQFDVHSYMKLLKNIKLKLKSHNSAQMQSVRNYNSIRGIQTHVLYNISRATNSNNIFYNKMVPSYHLHWYYEIHFVRVSRKYNKRSISRVRVSSRPSFWFGNLISCLLVGMFWGASLQWIDWILVQPLIIDINTVIAYIYMIIIYKYVSISLNRKIRLERTNLRVTRLEIYSFVKYYLYKFRWFD